jgi:glucose-6-phosphate 1-dehydrogenase
VVDPVLSEGPPVVEYEPGTWGPTAATSIVSEGASWHDPEKEVGPPC